MKYCRFFRAQSGNCCYIFLHEPAKRVFHPAFEGLRMEKKKKHIIVTVIGQDEVGIVAKIATSLAEQQINIIDINQTILGGELFAMTLLADRSGSELSLPEITDRLKQSVEGMSLKVTVQDSEVFQYMHRV